MKKLLGLALLSAVVAGPVQAQTAQWTEVCTNPAGPEFEYVTCMSAQLTYNAGTGAVDLWVWNLAGYGTSYSDSRIDSFGLFGVPWAVPSNLTFSAENAAGTDRTGKWEIATNGISGAGCCDLLFGIKQSGGPKVDIVSSNHTAPGGDDVTTWTGVGDFATGTGAFKFSWSSATGLIFNPADVYLYAHHKEATDGDSDQFYCLANPAAAVDDWCGGPDNPDDPQEIVPEPATMTLLATGLAGMAAARRRRKNNA